MKIAKHLFAPLMLLALNHASDIRPNACRNQPGCLAMTSVDDSIGLTGFHQVSHSETLANPFILSVECAPTHMIRGFVINNEVSNSPLSSLEGWTSVFIEQGSAIDQITATVEWLPDGRFHLW
jgi:hypothetical protein